MNSIKLDVIAGTIAFALTVGTKSIFAADLVVVPPDAKTAGGHEVWAHSTLGQSFIAQASGVKGGFYLWYSAETASLSTPNSPITDMNVNLYDGETLEPSSLLYSSIARVDSAINGFLDVDFSAAGITLTPGNKYTLSLSSPDRGWIVPSVCDYTVVQPTGAYADGHPFLQGTMVSDETGICDNAFHLIDTGSVAPTPTVTPIPTPTSTPTYTVTTRKAEFKGTILDIRGDLITVGKYVTYMTPSTVINYNYAFGFTVGQRLHVKGWKNSNGTVTATFIEVLN